MSNRKIKVYYLLEQEWSDLVSVWKRGTKKECKAMLDSCKKELKQFAEAKWRIVRVERYLA